MSKTYLIYPKILKGFAADLWQSNRRKVLVDLRKRAMIDGIEPYGLVGKGVWTATTNWEVLSNFDENDL